MRTLFSQMPQHVYDLSRNEWDYEIHSYCEEVCLHIQASINHCRRSMGERGNRPRMRYPPQELRTLKKELLICRLASGWLRIPQPFTDGQRAIGAKILLQWNDGLKRQGQISFLDDETIRCLKDLADV